MPFDALAPVTPEDALAALGITPVPDSVLQAHKHAMVVKLCSRRPLAAWHTVTWHTVAVDVERLRRLGQLYPRELTWWRSAPKAVAHLAARVQDAIPYAQFEVGYIQKDPYLNVCYGRQRACLAIWLNRSKRGLVAIATG